MICITYFFVVVFSLNNLNTEALCDLSFRLYTLLFFLVSSFYLKKFLAFLKNSSFGVLSSIIHSFPCFSIYMDLTRQFYQHFHYNNIFRAIIIPPISSFIKLHTFYVKIRGRPIYATSNTIAQYWRKSQQNLAQYFLKNTHSVYPYNLIIPIKYIANIISIKMMKTYLFYIEYNPIFF